MQIHAAGNTNSDSKKKSSCKLVNSHGNIFLRQMNTAQSGISIKLSRHFISQEIIDFHPFICFNDCEIMLVAIDN